MPTTEVILRDAVDDDLAAITAITNALIADTTVEWRDEEHSEESRRAWFAERVERGFPVVVAEADGDVIGFATYGDFRDSRIRPGYRFTVEHSVHVLRPWWGAGVGRRLVEDLVRRATEAGLHVMIGAVDASNAESIRFHERLGFVEVGRLPEVGTKFGRWLDLVLLQRML